MFQKTQNIGYLNLCIQRSKEIYLDWVEQFLDIIEGHIERDKTYSLNDVGCNLGQFWKGLKRRNLGIDYQGYDIEQIYLDKAQEVFPELKGKTALHDVTQTKPRESDISVMSAIVEHFADFSPGLDHVLAQSKKLVIVRTFLGDAEIKIKFLQKGAEIPYPINQYKFLDVLELFDQYGFKTKVLRDRATDSMPKLVERGILRTQYVVVGYRY
ncbi:MAG: hypothetical protein HQM16_01505 [Deltaproteobacteria bacterium]|nr:hypothetical protein [Deltaproteobacteria bacterium]